MNPPDDPGQTILRADREHRGIQLAVLLTILMASILSFIVIDPWLLAPLLGGGSLNDYRPFLRLVLGIIVGIALGGVAEYLLKRTWDSGRRIRLDDEGLTVEERGKKPQRINWDQRVNVLLWAYPLRGLSRGGRERRVPSSSYVYACQLLQNDCSAIIHAYLSPRQLRSTPGESLFTKLDVTRLQNSRTAKLFGPPERPTIPASLLTSKNGQMWAAEKERWAMGLELDPPDLSTLLEWLGRHGIIPAR